MELAAMLDDLTKRNRALAVWAACAVAREGLRFVPAHEKRPLQLLQAAEQWAKVPDKRRSILVLSRAHECTELLNELKRAPRSVHPKFIAWIRATTEAAIAAASPIFTRGTDGPGQAAEITVNTLVEAGNPMTRKDEEYLTSGRENDLEEIAQRAIERFKGGSARANPSSRYTLSRKRLSATLIKAGLKEADVDAVVSLLSEYDIEHSDVTSAFLRKKSGSPINRLIESIADRLRKQGYWSRSEDALTASATEILEELDKDEMAPVYVFGYFTNPRIEVGVEASLAFEGSTSVLEENDHLASAVKYFRERSRKVL